MWTVTARMRTRAKDVLVPLDHQLRISVSSAITDALDDEQTRERDLDRRYWAPLKEALEHLRHQRPR